MRGTELRGDGGGDAPPAGVEFSKFGVEFGDAPGECAQPGLPRTDRITDVYNAVSIAHLLPIGGEDRATYIGPPRLVRADGSETFETTAAGAPAVEHPEVGEVVWRDDKGVTCRRWNWRQCARTRITAETRSALFILDALDPLTDDAVHAAADALTDALLGLSPNATIHRRMLPPPTDREGELSSG
ncbi:MAG TPA: phenylalanine--tRNA ligase beta subunit-related protein [Actinomycetes bacterium]|nr:phenylalanine--tRNA ligase beta subunit-related protein [Actinomycetes bacterium]